VAVLYPVSGSIKMVPYAIGEETVNASTCNAAGTYPTPVTCNWQTYSNGTAIPNSQVQLFLSSDEKHKYAGAVLQCLHYDATAVASPVLFYVTKVTLYLPHRSFVLRIELVS
jgi:hypothetical protein